MKINMKSYLIFNTKTSLLAICIIAAILFLQSTNLQVQVNPPTVGTTDMIDQVTNFNIIPPLGVTSRYVEITARLQPCIKP